MNRRKTAKIILGLNLGPYRHVLNSILPLQGEPFIILVKVKHGDSLGICLQQPN